MMSLRRVDKCWRCGELEAHLVSDPMLSPGERRRDRIGVCVKCATERQARVLELETAKRHDPRLGAAY